VKGICYVLLSVCIEFRSFRARLAEELTSVCMQKVKSGCSAKERTELFCFSRSESAIQHDQGNRHDWEAHTIYLISD
jgi:hypothetical protein